MSFTYDVATDRGLLRLLITDTNASHYVFEDAEIDAFLALESGLKRAAALALETIAVSEALVLKVITVLELRTDGAAVARELRERAARLREQAAQDEGADDGGAFDIAEWAVSDFAYRDIVFNRAISDS